VFFVQAVKLHISHFNPHGKSLNFQLNSYCVLLLKSRTVKFNLF